MPVINFYVNPKSNKQSLFHPRNVDTGLSCFLVKCLGGIAIVLAILKGDV